MYALFIFFVTPCHYFFPSNFFPSSYHKSKCFFFPTDREGSSAVKYSLTDGAGSRALS